MLSQELTDKLQASASLLEIVTKYTTLEESRKALKGNCPFHHDNALSLMVMPAKNTFKCFGCGLEGGTVEFLAYIKRKAPVLLADQPGVAEKRSA